MLPEGLMPTHSEHRTPQATMKHKILSSILSLLYIALLGSSSLMAQQKKTLDHDAYDIWNRIDEQAISSNGNWVLYSQSPEDI